MAYAVPLRFAHIAGATSYMPEHYAKATPVRFDIL
jgi:hypothetical protein